MQADHHGPTAAFARAVRGLVGALTLAALVAVVVLFLVPPLVGLHRYVIEGGSMSPTIPRGSMAYEREVPVSSLRRGDVITFMRPGAQRPVTHRIIELTRPGGGAPVIRTRGDANAAADAQPLRLRSATQPRVSFHVPVVGWAVIALHDPRVRTGAIGAAALLLVLAALGSLWREGGRLEQRADADAGLGGS